MLNEGVVIAAGGIVVGVIGGLLLTRVVGGFIQNVEPAGRVGHARGGIPARRGGGGASLVPAARAARVDVAQALRSE